MCRSRLPHKPVGGTGGISSCGKAREGGREGGRLHLSLSLSLGLGVSCCDFISRPDARTTISKIKIGGRKRPNWKESHVWFWKEKKGRSRRRRRGFFFNSHDGHQEALLPRWNPSNLAREREGKKYMGVRMLIFFFSFFLPPPSPQNVHCILRMPPKTQGGREREKVEGFFFSVSCHRQISPGSLHFCLNPTNNFRFSSDAEILSISTDQAYKSAPNVQKRVCNVYIFWLGFHLACQRWWLGRDRALFWWQVTKLKKKIQCTFWFSCKFFLATLA